MRPLRLLAGVAAVLLYAGGYVAARVSSVLVHARATTPDAHGHQKVASHEVRVGAGSPALAGVVFFPLRLAETAGWFVLEPRGSGLGLP
jgi:hypothetical protein